MILTRISFFYFIIYKTMFLDTILGLPSQIISTVGNIATGVLSIPGQLGQGTYSGPERSVPEEKSLIIMRVLG